MPIGERRFVLQAMFECVLYEQGEVPACGVRRCECVAVLLMSHLFGWQSVPFGVRLTHKPVSHRRKVGNKRFSIVSCYSAVLAVNVEREESAAVLPPLVCT